MKHPQAKRVLVLLVFALMLFTPTVFGWTLFLSTDTTSLPIDATGIIVLDPDAWSRDALKVLIAGKMQPFAQLNIGILEKDRDFSRSADPKVLLLNPQKKRTFDPTIRFYSQYWKSLLTNRIREISQKGFRGLLITGIEEALRANENPYFTTEVTHLLEFLAREFKFQVPHSAVFLQCPVDFARTFQAGHFDGLVLAGLWIDATGRHTRPWTRKRILNTLKQSVFSGLRAISPATSVGPNDSRAPKAGPEILSSNLCLDFTKDPREQQRILAEAHEQGLDAAFTDCPKPPKRRFHQ